jgi:cbb3-type cytochrome oxidase maturation protein
MSVIYLLITISIIVAVLFLGAFIKAVKSGQYDDDYTPSVRMLFDDELVKEKPSKLIQTEKQKTILLWTNNNFITTTKLLGISSTPASFSV